MSSPYSANISIAASRAFSLYPFSVINTQSSAYITASIPILLICSIMGFILPTKSSVDSGFPYNVPVSIDGNSLLCDATNMFSISFLLQGAIPFSIRHCSIASLGRLL